MFCLCVCVRVEINVCDHTIIIPVIKLFVLATYLCCSSNKKTWVKMLSTCLILNYTGMSNNRFYARDVKVV